MENYTPKLFEYYQGAMKTLQKSDRSLKPLFPGTAFAAATLNLGPQTATVPHIDQANLAWGLCSITALGQFDPDRGGHCVLWDLGLLIRFPPGSTILIPSSLLRHSNAAVQDGELRQSYVQWSAGPLFQWVHSGCVLVGQKWAKLSKKAKAKQKKEDTRRYKEQLKLLVIDSRT